MSDKECRCVFPPIIYIFFLNICVEIACFICVCILCHISSKNPFKNHIVGDLNNYFYIIEENTDEILSMENPRNIDSNSGQIRKRQISNENTINIPLAKKLNNINFLKRHLVSKLFCTEMQDYFTKFNGRKLSDIFDLNYEKIHKLSVGVLVVSCTSIILFNIVPIIGKNFNKKTCFCSFFSRFYAIVLILIYTSKLVLSIILIYFIEKGDIEKYDGFLDCRNVKTTFFDRFSEISTLRKCSIAFLILNIIEQGIDRLQKCCDNIEKMSQLEIDK